ncbi:MAG TPA: hypothetical protein VK508_15425 [Cyclobacteriaceae bacterium]|nr:hypothetical protein [Cyclobacteriaceae bacterium]
MDFSNYSVKDFVLNESFQKWVLQPDEEIQALWDNWLSAHPEKAEIVAEARTTIGNIKRAIEQNVDCDSEDVWDRISKDIDDLKDETTPDKVGPRPTESDEVGATGHNKQTS